MKIKSHIILMLIAILASVCHKTETHSTETDIKLKISSKMQREKPISTPIQRQTEWYDVSWLRWSLSYKSSQNLHSECTIIIMVVSPFQLWNNRGPCTPSLAYNSTYIPDHCWQLKWSVEILVLFQFRT